MLNRILSLLSDRQLKRLLSVQQWWGKAVFVRGRKAKCIQRMVCGRYNYCEYCPRSSEEFYFNNGCDECCVALRRRLRVKNGR